MDNEIFFEKVIESWKSKLYDPLGYDILEKFEKF